MTLSIEDKKKKLRELLKQKDIGSFLNTYNYGDQLRKIIKKVVYRHRVSLRTSKSKQNLLLGEIINVISEEYSAQILFLEVNYFRKCKEKVGLSEVKK